MRGDFVDSYDPRMWKATWSPGRAPQEAVRSGASASLGRLPIGIAGGVAILLAGTVTAWLSRPSAQQAVAQAESPSPAPAAPSGPALVRRTLVLSKSSDLVDALVSSGLSKEVAQQVATAAAPGLRDTGEIRAVLTLLPTGNSFQLERLEASNADSSGVVVTRSASGALATSSVAAQVSTKTLVRHGTMDGDSFYTSAIAVGIPNSIIPEFAKALAFDFDFQREVTAGDAFEVAYAQPMNASGEAVGAPTLLYASLTTSTKSATIYRFAPDGKTDEWFDASGRSVVRALMRTPVDGARITSKFGMRFHPILKFLKLHGGIDFAAPTGTPIYASGSGVLEFAGPKGPNGNFVKIRHDNGWETLYLHMNRFMPGIVTGARVSQGQQIGEVGTTGRSTGPHLHYEVHIDGEKVDPLSIQTESGRTLDGAALTAFEKARDKIDVSRASQAN
ncbi:MAG: M23 family metallopeptidase [Sphingomonas sp.]